MLYQPPFWLHALLWLPLILIVTLLPLRPIKALMIALQHRHKAAEGRLEMRDAAAMIGFARSRGGCSFPALFTIVGLAILISLGVWQLQRKEWKEGADRDARTRRWRQSRSPLPPPSQ